MMYSPNIDSHQHVFWHGRDDRGLITDMDEQGIEKAWLLSWEIAPDEKVPDYHGILNPLHMRPDGTHAGIPLSDLVLARDRYPHRMLLGYCPHPLRGDAPALLESAQRMYGARICGEWKFQILFDDPRCLQVYRKAGELGMPVVLHLDVPFLPDGQGNWEYQKMWYGGTVANLERALQACPDTNFIGHAPGFWREISGDADQMTTAYNPEEGAVVSGGRVERLFQNHSNLYADLSAHSALRALKRDLTFCKEFIGRYADRLLFGRDYYGDDLHRFLQSLDLPKDVTRKIYFENANRLIVADPD